MWPISQFMLETLPWIIFGIWVAQLSFVIAGTRYRQKIGATDPINNKQWPKVSVLVAARNEEDCIENCLRSLASQDYPHFEIIAIDDRSSDNTPAILARLENEFQGRLKVIRVKSLPAGWLGKAHAMHTGMQFASGDWILFTDADCEQKSQRTLSLAVNEAWQRNVELLTLIPKLTASSIWEKLTLPVCSFLMMIWFQPRRVNDPRSSVSYANGAFILISRRCYDTVGGWASVRMRLCEDFSLARDVKAVGIKMAMLENDGLYHARMYDSIVDSWNGWSRIFYGCLSQKIILISAIRLIAISIIPTWCFLFVSAQCLLAPQTEQAAWHSALGGWAAVIACQQLQALISFRLVGVPLRWSLGIHLSHLIVVGMLTRALLNQLGVGAVRWRGTVVQQGRIVHPTVPAAVQPRVVTRTSRKAPVLEPIAFSTSVENQLAKSLKDIS